MPQPDNCATLPSADCKQHKIHYSSCKHGGKRPCKPKTTRQRRSGKKRSKGPKKRSRGPKRRSTGPSRRSTRPRRRPKQASRQDEGRPGLPRVQLLQRFRMVVVRFRAVQPFLLFGVMLSSQQGFRSSLSRFHCVGLQLFGEREGLLAAAGSGKSGCPSCFADASERGVSPRLVGCGCCCLRLDFQVAVSVRGSQGAWVLSAFSTRTLPSTGVPARRVQGASAWACLWFVALLHVVVRFRAVHRCCVLGCGFPLKISLWLSCLHCVGFQHFGEWEGLLAASGSGKSGCSLCFADASEQGVSPRIEVGGLTWFALALRSPGCSCFCLRLDFQVTVSVRGGQGSQPWVPLAHGL